MGEGISDEERKPAAVSTKRGREVNQVLLNKVNYIQCLVKDGYITTNDEVVGHFLE